MVTSPSTIKKIREIIEKHYRFLSVSLLGKGVLTDLELQALVDAGVNLPNNTSVIELIYNHNFINNGAENKPNSLGGIIKQQLTPGIKPVGRAHEFTIDSLNHKMAQLIDKLKVDTTTRLESIVRNNNDIYKLDALQNLRRDSLTDQLVKESSLGRVKQLLQDTAEVANRDWKRVALTEMSNAIGAGSVDRIVTNNADKDLGEVIVYRLPVNDSATCFGKDELILMGDGSYKKAGDLKPGDLVQAPNRQRDKNKGSSTKIIATSVIQSELFEYEFEDGTSIKCTEDHPILVKTKNFLGFIRVKCLEHSKVHFKVLKYEEMSVGEKVRISNFPIWAKRIDSTFTDLHYFWIKYGTDILKDIEESFSFKEVQKRWGLPALSSNQHLSDFLKLNGCDISKYAKNAISGNNFNRKYTDELTRSKFSTLNKDKEGLRADLLDKGIKRSSELYGVGRRLLIRWIKATFGHTCYDEILSNGKSRGGVASNIKIDNTPGLREKISQAARERLLDNIVQSSKPHLALYERVKLVYPEALIEAPILKSFRADILIGKVIIEYDGSGHFLFKPDGKRQDFIRDKLCRESGYSVIRIKAPNDRQPCMEKLTKLVRELEPQGFAILEEEHDKK